MRPRVPPAASRWLRRRWAGLAVFVLVAAVARIVIARGIKAPVVLCDEFIYSGLAKNLAEHGRHEYRGVPSRQSYLYPC